MTKDTLYCPKCNSSNLHVGKKGFSTTKAFIGKAITRSNFGGILVGSIGANDLQITCLSCGHTFKPGQATGHRLPSEAEIHEFESHVIKPENVIQDRYDSYLCDCGRYVGLPVTRPYCPSCGRWLSERHIEAGKKYAEEERKRYQRNDKITKIVVCTVGVIIIIGIITLFL